MGQRREERWIGSRNEKRHEHEERGNQGQEGRCPKPDVAEGQHEQRDEQADSAKVVRWNVLTSAKIERTTITR